MTSKTFKSVWNERTRLVHVMPVAEGVNIQVSDAVWNGQYGSTIAPSDAPALALAVLEAARADSDLTWSGAKDYGNADHLGRIAAYLDAYIKTQERTTAAAKEQAELEAEALELCNAARKDGFNPPLIALDELSEGNKGTWLAVARRAREMRNPNV